MNQAVACYLCGAAAQRILMALKGRDGQPYRAMRCPACGVVYAHPQPPLRETPGSVALADQYDEGYYESNWGEEGKGYRDETKLALMLEESDRQREAIRELTGIGTGRLLDIGCGDGRYIAGFQRAGWDVTGVEISPVAVQWAREQFQVEVIEGALEEAELPANGFDVVRMKHCIEHLRDPADAVRRVYDLLRPGGVVVIDTDNADGLRSRLEVLVRHVCGPLAVWAVKTFMKKELGGRYGRLTPPVHLYQFTPRSLERLLCTAGFEPLRIMSVAHGDPVWFPLVNRFRAHPVEALFRLVDYLGWKFLNRGEALVILSKKPE